MSMEIYDAASKVKGSLSYRANQLIAYLSSESMMSKFIKIQWNVIYQFARLIIEKDNVKQGDFRELYSKVAEHIQEDSLLEQFLLVAGSPQEVKDEHHLILGKVCFCITACILHHIANMSLKESSTESISWKNVSDMGAEGRGKVRYCGAWAVVKVRESCKRYVRENGYSHDVKVRERVYEEYQKKMVLDHLQANSQLLHSNSEHIETLKVTEERQYRNHGLTHLTDDAYLFFLDLEQARVNEINHSKLNKYKGQIFNKAENSLLSNEKLKLKWNFLFAGLPNQSQSQITGQKFDLAVIVAKLFNAVVIRYLHMGGKQYLRDYRRDFKWKKEEELRKRVTERKEMAQKKDQRITAEEIEADTTEGKSYSHARLKAQVMKDKLIFTRGHLYKKQFLKLICRAYNIPNKDMRNKETMNNALSAKIPTCNNFPNPDVFM